MRRHKPRVEFREEILPLETDEERVDIEQDARSQQQSAVLEKECLRGLTKLDQVLRFVDDQQSGNESCQKSEAAEEDFQLNNPGNEKNFGGNHPEECNVVPAELEGDRGKD